MNDLIGYLRDQAYRRKVHAWLREFPFEAMYLEMAVPMVAFSLAAVVAVLAFLD